MKQNFTVNGDENHWRHILEFCGIRVYICHCQKEFDYPAYRESNVTGYSTENEIWVIGKEYEDKIYCNLHDLGHELGHMIARYCPEFIDPHQYPLKARIEGDY